MPTPRRRVDILIAVYPGNTEDITRNFPLIQKACRETLPFVRWRITLAYNGHPSSLEEIKRLAQNEKHVRVTYVKKPGKGMALLNTLIRTDADIAAYMDADLATSLKDLPTLIREIEKGADLVGG
ncbi:MAG: glycosyltransferase, partial [archaeon]|nr:glycosyltransferase [archaeon]